MMTASFNTFLRDNESAIDISLIFFVLGAIVSALATYLTARRVIARKVVSAVRFNKTELFVTEVQGSQVGLQIAWRGQPITQPTLVVIRLQNVGKQAVLRSDFEPDEGFTFDVGPKVVIKSFDVIRARRKLDCAELTSDDPNSKRILSIGRLHKRDWVEVQMMVEGSAVDLAVTIKADCGLDRPIKFEPVSQRPMLSRGHLRYIAIMSSACLLWVVLVIIAIATPVKSTVGVITTLATVFLLVAIAIVESINICHTAISWIDYRLHSRRSQDGVDVPLSRPEDLVIDSEDGENANGLVAIEERAR